MQRNERDGSRISSVIALAVLAAMALLSSSQVVARAADGGDSPVVGFRSDDGIFSAPPLPDPMNAPPVADAGPDQQVYPNTTVTLNGSGSGDPDGDPLSYLWSQVSGTPVTLNGTRSPEATFVSSDPGVLEFRLAVWDDAWVSTPPERFGLWPGCCWELPQVVVDAAGNAMAVMVVDDYVYNVWAKRYVAGIGWEPAVLIETGSGDSGSVDVTIDPSGNVIAAWRQWDGTNWIQANRYTAGVGWEAAVPVSSDPSEAGRPQVAVDAAGNAIAVWRQWDGTNWSIRASRYVAGMGWGTNALLESAPGEAWDPQVAVDPAGNATVVWRQWDGTYSSIWANRYVLGVGWNNAILIESDWGDATNPQVVADSSGNALAVWQWFDGVASSIRANRYDVGIGWGVPTLVESDSVDAWNPRLAGDAAGNAVAAWESPSAIWANHFEVDGGWDAPYPLHSDPGGYSAKPEVAMNPAGTAVVMWEGWLGPEPERVRAASFTLGIGWGPSIPLQGYGDTLWFPQIAIDPAGYATVLMLHWSEPINAFDDIGATRFHTGSSSDTTRVTVLDDPPSNSYLPSSQTLTNATQTGGNCGSAWGDLTWSDDARCSYREVDRSPADQIGVVIVPDGTDVRRWSASGCSKDASPWDELDDGADTHDSDVTCRQGSKNGDRVGVTLTDPSWTDAADVDDFTVVVSSVARKVSSASASVSIDAKVGASQYNDGVTQATTTSYVRYSRTMNTNPVSGSEWTPTSINDLRIATRCVDCSPNNRATQMQATVDALYNAEHALEVRFAWSGVPLAGDRWTLVVECQRLSPGAENVLVQVGQGGNPPTNWVTAYTCTSDSDLSFSSYELSAAERNGGAPVVRVWDDQADTPDDAVQGTMALDVLRIDVGESGTGYNPWPFCVDENLPLRDQPPLVNTVAGAIAIQKYIDRNEWAIQSSDAVPYAVHIWTVPQSEEDRDDDDLNDDAGVRGVLIQMERRDQVVPNPGESAVVEAESLEGQTTYYRHDHRMP